MGWLGLRGPRGINRGEGKGDAKAKGKRVGRGGCIL
jgi:hypothetical protein